MTRQKGHAPTRVPRPACTKRVRGRLLLLSGREEPSTPADVCRQVCMRSTVGELQPGALEHAIAFDDARVRARVASNPTLTVDHLERLIADEDASVRATALAHPGLSTEQLARALASDRDGIRAIAIGHSLATEAQLLAAIEDDAEAVRQRAIGNPNCPRRVVEAFLRRPNAHEAATSPNLNAGDVDHLANDERSYRASAEHPAAGPSTLDRLARRHPDTLFRVARHPNTSIETLQWIEFESETGRGLTFANPNTPDHWRTAALVPGVAPEVVKCALRDAQDVDGVLRRAYAAWRLDFFCFADVHSELFH